MTEKVDPEIKWALLLLDALESDTPETWAPGPDEPPAPPVDRVTATRAVILARRLGRYEDVPKRHLAAVERALRYLDEVGE